jgi:Fe-S-cluster containining protein
MDMQTIVHDWKKNAERHADRNFDFLHSLKMKNDDVVDRAAQELHAEAFSIIDCLECANCCKTAATLLTQDDILRIAGHLGMKVPEFVATYLQADQTGEFYLKGLPCPFLAEDNRCKIYDVRPQDCVEYPHTHKQGFSYRTYSVAANTLTCPAVFYIVEQMRARSRER